MIFRQLYLLKRNKYQKIYKKVEQRLDAELGDNDRVDPEGLHEGTVRPNPDSNFENHRWRQRLEQFFQRYSDLPNQISYNEALGGSSQ